MFALGNEVESNESREGFAQDDSAPGLYLINLMTLKLKGNFFLFYCFHGFLPHSATRNTVMEIVKPTVRE